MSTEFDEMIALSCPDLKTSTDDGPNNQVQFIESERRSSLVKPMTATELAIARAALIKQPSFDGGKWEEAVKKSSASMATSSISLPQCGDERSTGSPASKSKCIASLSASRNRISSLPNLVGEASEQQIIAFDYRTVTSKMGRKIDRQLDDSIDHSKSSVDNDIAKSTIISDSIEILRMKNCEQKQEDERNNSYSQSQSMSKSKSPNIKRRYDHERSAAPDRIHSSSLSSIGSAVSTSISASVSMNASKNTSRRGSTVSSTAEASKLQSTQPVVPTIPVIQATFPTSNTQSDPSPNLERRNSNLSTFFPGASELSSIQPSIHTDPKMFEKALLTAESNKKEEEPEPKVLPRGKFIHRTKTPPPLGVKLGVNLKKVTPPRTQITVKKNVAPMLGVVLRKVEKNRVPQKSILDDDKPLYHFSIVRSDHKEYKPDKPKPKPKPAAKPNPGGISTGPQVIRQPPVIVKPQKPLPGVPITIQKIEGDKIIIIKKIIVPKNSKIPEQYRQVGLVIGHSSCNVMWYALICC